MPENMKKPDAVGSRIESDSETSRAILENIGGLFGHLASSEPSQASLTLVVTLLYHDFKKEVFKIALKTNLKNRQKDRHFIKHEQHMGGRGVR